jgi:ATP-dependent DNA helicase RecG
MLIDELLERREDRNVEFKRDTSSLGGILEDYVAAANTADAWIIIGAEDDGEVIGVDDPQADEERLS